VLSTRHGAPRPLTFSAAYESNWTLLRYLKPKVGAYGAVSSPSGFRTLKDFFCRPTLRSQGNLHVFCYVIKGKQLHKSLNLSARGVTLLYFCYIYWLLLFNVPQADNFRGINGHRLCRILCLSEKLISKDVHWCWQELSEQSGNWTTTSSGIAEAVNTFLACVVLTHHSNTFSDTVICASRLTSVGHIARPSTTVVLLRPAWPTPKRLHASSRPRLTWLWTVQSDLIPLNIDLATAYPRAQN